MEAESDGHEVPGIDLEGKVSEVKREVGVGQG